MSIPRANWRFPAVLVIAALCAILIAPFAPGWSVSLAVVVVAKSLVVLGRLILRRAGLVSFGQGLSYALGGYTAALAESWLGLHDLSCVVPLAAIVGLTAGWLLGFLLARYRAIFFANLNLAFSMLLFGILARSEALGSTDGLGVGTPTFLGILPGEPERLPLLFAVTVVVFVAVLFLTDRFFRSTVGRLSAGVRDNEIRVEYLGYPVTRICHVLIVGATLLGALGGALTAYAVGHVDPQMSYWTTSGEFLFVAILSGNASVVAPLIGSLIFELVRTFANEYAPMLWQIILGIALLLSILFLPDGIWSLFIRPRLRTAS